MPSGYEGILNARVLYIYTPQVIERQKIEFEIGSSGTQVK